SNTTLDEKVMQTSDCFVCWRAINRDDHILNFDAAFGNCSQCIGRSAKLTWERRRNVRHSPVGVNGLTRWPHQIGNRAAGYQAEGVDALVLCEVYGSQKGAHFCENCIALEVNARHHSFSGPVIALHS